MAVPVALCHLLFFALIFSRTPLPEPAPQAPDMLVAELFAPPPPPPAPVTDDPGGAPKAPEPTPAETPAPVRPAPPAPAPTAPRRHVPKVPPPPEVKPLPVAARTQTTPAPPNVVLGEAALVGAATAGSGGGGGSGGTGGGTGSGDGSGDGRCDMVRRLQDALRRDPEVRSAVSQAYRPLGGGKAILIWDGEWTRSPGQEGRGLAGVRQAIAMEVAFAPEACRAEPMRGLVVISFADAPGAPKLALGGGDWRWSQLLSARR